MFIAENQKGVRLQTIPMAEATFEWRLPDTQYSDNGPPNGGWISNGEWLEYLV